MSIELATVLDFLLQWIESGENKENAKNKAIVFANNYLRNKDDLKIAKDLITRIANI